MLPESLTIDTPSNDADPLWQVPLQVSVEPDFGNDTAIIPNFEADILAAESNKSMGTYPIAALSALTVWVNAPANLSIETGDELRIAFPLYPGSAKKTTLRYRFIQSIELNKTQRIFEFLLHCRNHKSCRNKIAQYVSDNRFLTALGPDQESSRQTTLLRAQQVMNFSPWQCVAAKLDKSSGMEPLFAVLTKSQSPHKMKWDHNLTAVWPPKRYQRIFAKSLFSNQTTVVCRDMKAQDESAIDKQPKWRIFSLPNDAEAFKHTICEPVRRQWFVVESKSLPRTLKDCIKTSTELDKLGASRVGHITHFIWFKPLTFPGHAWPEVKHQNQNEDSLVIPLRQRQSDNETFICPPAWPQNAERRKQVRLDVSAHCKVWIGKITHCKAVLKDFSVSGCSIKFSSKANLNRLRKYIRLTVPGTPIARVKYTLISMNNLTHTGHFRMCPESQTRYVPETTKVMQYLAEREGVELDHSGTKRFSERRIWDYLVQLAGQLHPGVICHLNQTPRTEHPLQDTVICATALPNDNVTKTVQDIVKHYCEKPDIIAPSDGNGPTFSVRGKSLSMKAILEPDGRACSQLSNLLRSESNASNDKADRRHCQWSSVTTLSNDAVSRIHLDEFVDKLTRHQLAKDITDDKASLQVISVDACPVADLESQYKRQLNVTRQHDASLARYLLDEIRSTTYLVFMHDTSVINTSLLNVSLSLFNDV